MKTCPKEKKKIYSCGAIMPCWTNHRIIHLVHILLHSLQYHHYKLKTANVPQKGDMASLEWKKMVAPASLHKKPGVIYMWLYACDCVCDWLMRMMSRSVGLWDCGFNERWRGRKEWRRGFEWCGSKKTALTENYPAIHSLFIRVLNANTGRHKAWIMLLNEIISDSATVPL